MLVIRLSRTGRTKYPTYRIVAADSQRAATGKFVMILGHYNPHTKELVIKHDQTLEYLGNGAQPSNAVIKLLQKDNVKLPDWVSLKTRNRPAKKAAPEVKAAAPAEVTESEAAPAAEPTAETEAPAESTDQAPESVAEVAQEQKEAVAENAAVDNKVETAADVEAAAAGAEAVLDAGAEAVETAS